MRGGRAVGRPDQGGADETDFRMSVLMGIGGFVSLVTAWCSGVIDVSADRVVEHSAAVATELAGRFLDREPQPRGPHEST